MAAYAALQEHQGELLPRLFTTVRVESASPDVPIPTHLLEHIQIHGVMIQYLPGFTLSEMVDHAPRQAWSNAIDQAVSITRVLGDCNVLNADVRPSNFMVLPTDAKQYHVYMIDFGQCRLRRAGESDHAWGRAKWTQDEEGAVGLVMEHRLKKLDFEYEFKASWRYIQWAPGEDD